MCPYLEFTGSDSGFSSTEQDYRCKITGQYMDLYSDKVKYTCRNGESYTHCPYYKNR